MQVEHIFFYGTLMQGFALRQRLQLDGLLEYIGKGVVLGQLFDFGRYPGLVCGDGQVFGELYRIVVADTLLTRTDFIEGYKVVDPTAGEYQRVLLPVRLEDGITVEAWVYLYNLSIGAASKIIGGDYRRYIGQLSVESDGYS